MSLHTLEPSEDPSTAYDSDGQSTTSELYTYPKEKALVAQSESEGVVDAIGLLPEEAYERTLNPWRFAIRRLLVRSLAWESRAIGHIQRATRTPFLDEYFVHTSSLGTHTFFMTMLPALLFFGYQDATRALLFVLALGVYVSSVLKDLMCSPRPFSPPVTRLTTRNTHHMEYGFPSTHSTNSISIALFFFTIIHRLRNTPSMAFSPPIMPSDPLLQNATHIAEDVLPEMQISLTTYILCVSTLSFYVFSIVFGRIYTGMHSFVDCAFGAALGAGLWGLYVLVGEAVDSWLRNSGWIVPIIVVPFCLLLVHRHPEPVDDCPCFEDAIAFMSVVMGEFLTRWYMYRNNYDETFFVRSMPGKANGTWAEMQLWWSIAAAKMVIGILAIFAWRIFAKALMHRILPPTFRLLSRLTTLPHRRYYTPATDYTGVPSDKGLHPIPSVLDLPGMLELDSDSVSTAHKPYALSSQAIKLRAGKSSVKFEKSTNISTASREGLGLGLQEMGGKRGDIVAHYDADVLTKVFVYCGIGMLASGVMPIMFEVVGWGL